MPTTRAILARLSRDELLGVLDAYELAVPNGRGKDQLVEVLVASEPVRLDDVLPAFPRVRLKALCLACGLDDGGREKAVLVEWLTETSTVAQRTDDNPTEGVALPLSARRTHETFMITGDLKSKIDRIWDTMWSGGISNPLSVIEQLTYLLFIKRLDELHTLKERKAARTGTPIGEPVFAASQDPLRWSRFKETAPEQMFETVRDGVFPFIKTEPYRERRRANDVS